MPRTTMDFASFERYVHEQQKKLQEQVYAYVAENTDEVLRHHPHFLHGHENEMIIDNYYDEYFYHHRRNEKERDGKCTIDVEARDESDQEPMDCYVYVVCEDCNISVEFPCRYKDINRKARELFQKEIGNEMVKRLLGVGERK